VGVQGWADMPIGSPSRVRRGSSRNRHIARPIVGIPGLKVPALIRIPRSQGVSQTCRMGYEEADPATLRAACATRRCRRGDRLRPGPPQTARLAVCAGSVRRRRRRPHPRDVCRAFSSLHRFARWSSIRTWVLGTPARLRGFGRAAMRDLGTCSARLEVDSSSRAADIGKRWRCVDCSMDSTQIGARHSSSPRSSASPTPKRDV